MDLHALLYAGILLITGLLFGKLAKLVRLPNVTGYLVGGLLIGPSLIGILSENAVSSMGLISNIALGFIAFSIGNELKLSYFKKVGPGPIIIAVFESLLAVIVVFVALIVYYAIVGSLDTTNIRFALVLSAIAAATAPAATLMVVRQYKAKGNLTNTLMSVVAIDDGTAIMFFGICIAIANALGNNGASSQPLVLQILEPLWEIFLSLGIGALLGLLLTLACKWWTGRGNRISLVVAFIFLTIFLTDLLGGSALLACMALGGVFANLSSKYEEVNGLVYFVTPPIFMMFFVPSGADLKTEVLGIVGIIGAIYVLFRVAGKFAGAWLGAKISHAEPKVSKYLGWTLIPQAGVAIGLSLIATQVLNAEMGSKIRAIVLCATLIYELIGPLITKTALKKAGEITVES
jgi:Kef-type K+ transport system membrane component KefB